MQEDKHRHKSNVWAWVAGTLAVLIICGYTGCQNFKKDLANPNSKLQSHINQQVEKMVLDASDSLYHIEYYKFDLDVDLRSNNRF